MWPKTLFNGQILVIMNVGIVLNWEIEKCHKFSQLIFPFFPCASITGIDITAQDMFNQMFFGKKRNRIKKEFDESCPFNVVILRENQFQKD